MTQLLGLILISFLIASFLLVPFIDLLFYLRKRYKSSLKTGEVKDEQTPIHNQLLVGKDVNTPVGGGVLVILIVSLLSFAAAYFTTGRLSGEIYLLVFTLLSFGAIGLVDDLRKVFISFSGKYAGVKARYLVLFQFISAAIISSILYFGAGFNNLFVPLIGNIILGWVYIPLAIFAIVAFANAYNISDGLDGLSSGLLLICLFAFLALSHTVFNQNLAIFTGIWIGSLIAYLYFNIYPARVYLGDAGAFGFGATLAVIGLLTGKILALGVIGGVYVVIIASSLAQIIAKRVFGRKILPVAPIHMYFRYIGWPEPKIVMRFWVSGTIFAIFGLWLALLS